MRPRKTGSEGTALHRMGLDETDLSSKGLDRTDLSKMFFHRTALGGTGPDWNSSKKGMQDRSRWNGQLLLN